MGLIQQKITFICVMLGAIFAATYADSDNSCNLAPKTGPCRAKMPRYYWDSDANPPGCYEFVYGGCDANANNFEDLRDCADTCGNDLCSLPVEVGPCRARKPRFFWDNEAQKCTSFGYGGCRGNANNFPTLKYCNHVCSPRSSERNAIDWSEIFD